MKLRWTTLFLVATVMMMGYVFWDIASPISTTLKAPVSDGGMEWTSSEYGFFAGSYSILNIFLLMLFFGGIILDKAGIRFTGMLSTTMMLVGAAINYYAIACISPSPSNDVHVPFTLFGLIPNYMKLQVLIASLGFGLFGVGCDITGITVSKIVTKWFAGHELASAMGIQVAMARLGTASAISFSPVIANNYGLSAPLLVGTLLLLVGCILFVSYIFMDRFYEHCHQQDNSLKSVTSTDDSFSFHDFLSVLKNPGFWLIVLLCVFFYSSLRPFMKFATDILVHKYDVAETTAGWIVSVLPYGTIVLTPLFGSVYDRIGHGASLMFIGCTLVTLCHVVMLLPIASTPWIAVVIMFLHGVAFSLVPSALWPSVPKIVPLKQLGTAYSIIYFIQNIGLMVVPVYVGKLTDAEPSAGNYTLPMLFFIMLGLLSLVAALALIIYDKRKNIGLESPNIERNR